METKNKILQRFSDCEIKVEQREDGEETRKITGYAAVFNKWSNPLGMDGWFREKIDARAFDNVLNDDVVAVFNHDNNIILARNKKTLNLLIDEIGLRYEFDAPKSPNGDNILAASKSRISALAVLSGYAGKVTGPTSIKLLISVIVLSSSIPS